MIGRKESYLCKDRYKIKLQESFVMSTNWKNKNQTSRI